MTIIKGKKYTSDEFFELTPDSNSERYELINGEIVALAAPSMIHQEIVGGVYSEIRQFIKNKKGGCKPFVSPFDVRLDNYNTVQPDILVVCDPNKLDDKRCNGAPDLVIEVTSSNSKWDYINKLHLYCDFGVREYWIIDPEKKKTVVYLLESNNDINIYTFEQDVPVGIFGNELAVNVAELI